LDLFYANRHGGAFFLSLSPGIIRHARQFPKGKEFTLSISKPRVKRNPVLWKQVMGQPKGKHWKKQKANNWQTGKKMI
jgi:hypothetical protein